MKNRTQSLREMMKTNSKDQDIMEKDQYADDLKIMIEEVPSTELALKQQGAKEQPLH